MWEMGFTPKDVHGLPVGANVLGCIPLYWTIPRTVGSPEISRKHDHEYHKVHIAIVICVVVTKVNVSIYLR
jgi:hypothetical protein